MSRALEIGGVLFGESRVAPRLYLKKPPAPPSGVGLELADGFVTYKLLNPLFREAHKLVEVLTHHPLIKCVLGVTHHEHHAEGVQLNTGFRLIV